VPARLAVGDRRHPGEPQSNYPRGGSLDYLASHHLPRHGSQRTNVSAIRWLTAWSASGRAKLQRRALDALEKTSSRMPVPRGRDRRRPVRRLMPGVDHGGPFEGPISAAPAAFRVPVAVPAPAQDFVLARLWQHQASLAHVRARATIMSRGPSAFLLLLARPPARSGPTAWELCPWSTSTRSASESRLPVAFKIGATIPETP